MRNGLSDDPERQNRVGDHQGRERNAGPNGSLRGVTKRDPVRKEDGGDVAHDDRQHGQVPDQARWNLDGRRGGNRVAGEIRDPRDALDHERPVVGDHVAARDG